MFTCIHMQNVIKIYHLVHALSAFLITANEWTDDYSAHLRIVHTCGSCTPAERAMCNKKIKLPLAGDNLNLRMTYEQSPYSHDNYNATTQSCFPLIIHFCNQEYSTSMKSIHAQCINPFPYMLYGMAIFYSIELTVH